MTLGNRCETKGPSIRSSLTIALAALAWVLWHDSSTYSNSAPDFRRPKVYSYQAVAGFETKTECEKSGESFAWSAARSQPQKTPVPVTGGALFRAPNNTFIASRFECWPAGVRPYERSAGP